MVDGDLAHSLIGGLLFLLNGAGAALLALPGRYKLTACVPWAAMLICLGASMEGVDAAAPWPNFVKTCFAAWALLLAIPFAVAARRTMRRGHDEPHHLIADESSHSG